MGRLVNKQAVDLHVQCQLSASVYQCIWRKAAEELQCRQEQEQSSH